MLENLARNVCLYCCNYDEIIVLCLLVDCGLFSWLELAEMLFPEEFNLTL